MDEVSEINTFGSRIFLHHNFVQGGSGISSIPYSKPYLYPLSLSCHQRIEAACLVQRALFAQTLHKYSTPQTHISEKIR